MSAIIELVPPIKIEDASWEQPTDSIIDVSGYTEAAIMLSMPGYDPGSGTTTVNIMTAVENREDHYIELASNEYSGGTTPEALEYFYLAGSTTGSSTAPGFARFLRVTVTQTGSSPYLILGVTAVLKP